MQQEQNDSYAQNSEHRNGSVLNDNGANYEGRNTAESQRTLGENNFRTVNGVKYANNQAPVSSNF